MRYLTPAEVERWHAKVEQARIEAYKREWHYTPTPPKTLPVYRKFILEMKARAKELG